MLYYKYFTWFTVFYSNFYLWPLSVYLFSRKGCDCSHSCWTASLPPPPPWCPPPGLWARPPGRGGPLGCQRRRGYWPSGPGRTGGPAPSPRRRRGWRGRPAARPAGRRSPAASSPLLIQYICIIGAVVLVITNSYYFYVSGHKEGSISAPGYHYIFTEYEIISESLSFHVNTWTVTHPSASRGGSWGIYVIRSFKHGNDLVNYEKTNSHCSFRE